MSEQMEKLEGDVARIIYVELRTSGITARRVAKELIARTLKAVVDGMPLPGERDRGALWKHPTTGAWEACGQDASKWPEEGYLDFIALSPTSHRDRGGTGEEE